MKIQNLSLIRVVVAILIAGGNRLDAATLYVWQDSPDPFPFYDTWETAAHTIQEAVDVASDGDTVLVTEGEYRISAQVTINKAIVVQSEKGPAQTLINAENTTRCLLISNSLTVVSGFTIENGTENVGGLAGGVVMIGGTLSNCVVQWVMPRGRLVYCSSGGLITDVQMTAHNGTGGPNGP